MISDDTFDDFMSIWAATKDKQVINEVGWADHSVAQVMIDSAKLGCLIPGTKPKNYIPLSTDVCKIMSIVNNSGLSDRQRLVIYLRFTRNNGNKKRLKPLEIADIMGVSVKSYFNAYSEAKKKLKACL